MMSQEDASEVSMACRDAETASGPIQKRHAGPICAAAASTSTMVNGCATQAHPRRAVMQAVFGGRRVKDMLVGEQLPGIC